MFLLLPGLKRFHQVHDMSAFVLNKSGKSGASSIIWMQTRVKCVCVCVCREVLADEGAAHTESDERQSIQADCCSAISAG